MKSKSDPNRGPGFTLISDIVINNTSLITAVVYGLVYRHTQMRNHTCYASIGTMASLAGIHRRTIERHLAILVEKGYIEDLTPDLVGYPHKYVLTDKVGLLIDDKTPQDESESEDDGVSQSDAGVRQNDVGVRQNVLGGYDTKSQVMRQKVVQGDNIGDKVVDKRGIQEREGSPSNTSEHSEDLQMNLNNSREGNNNREDSQKKVKTLINEGNQEEKKESNTSTSNGTERRGKIGLLSEKQRTALEALGDAMHMNFTLYRKASDLAEFLISAFSKGQGPNQYAQWAASEGMHKNEMSRYAAFPDDIIKEYSRAFMHGITYNADDVNLFQNKLRIPVKSSTESGHAVQWRREATLVREL